MNIVMDSSLIASRCSDLLLECYFSSNNTPCSSSGINCNYFSNILTITTYSEISPGEQIVLKLNKVFYGENMSPQTLTVFTEANVENSCSGKSFTIDTFINTQDWHPISPSKFQSFDFTPKSAKTCEHVELLWSIRPEFDIVRDSIIKISFTADIDLLTASDSDLYNISKVSANVFEAKLSKNCYSSIDCTIKISDVVMPNIEMTGMEFNVTISTYDNMDKVHENNYKGIVVSAITHDYGSKIKSTNTLIVGEQSRYSIEIKRDCGIIASPIYYHISIPNIFTAVPGTTPIIDNQDLDAGVSTMIEFDIINPISARKPPIIEEFFITVVQNNLGKAFVVNASLDPTLEIISGNFIDFKLSISNSQGGKNSDYVFSIEVAHTIPVNGILTLTLNPLVECQNCPSNTIVSALSALSYDPITNTIKIILLEGIANGSTLTITLINAKNPLVADTYKGFNVKSTDDSDRGIDLWSDVNNPVAIITTPSDATVFCIPDNRKNRKSAKYTCTFKSGGVLMPYSTATNTLKIEIPNDLTCTDAIIPSISSTPTMVRQGVIELLVSGVSTDTLVVELSCTNPDTTKETDQFVFTLLTDTSKSILAGKTAIQTVIGSEISDCILNCDHIYPSYLTNCSLWFRRDNSHRITSIELHNSRIRESLVDCNAITPSGESHTCKANSENITVTYDNDVNRFTFEIVKISYFNPNHDQTNNYPFSMTTYYDDGNKIYKVDESANMGMKCLPKIECNYKCLTCDTIPDNCTVCTDDTDDGTSQGNHYYVYEGIGVCEVLRNDQCNGGYFKDEHVNYRLCRKCNRTKCITCMGNSENCTECQPSAGYLYEGDCYETCPERTYPSFNQCFKCSDKCLVCTSDQDCSECEQDYFLDEDECKRDCPSGYYASSTTRKCEKCYIGCDTCTEGSCRTCEDNYYFYNFKCIEENECIINGTHVLNKDDNTCDPCAFPCDECYGNTTSCRTCHPTHPYLLNDKCLSSCPSGYYTSSYKCLPCNPACATCYGPGIDECYSCTEDYLLVIDKNRCDYLKCPDGYYETGKICDLCSTNCHTCVNSFTHCLSCTGTFHLFYDNKCWSECPTGTYKSGNNCYPCDSPCYTCENSSMECTGCARPYPYLYGNTCEDKCPDKTTLIGTTCVPCNSSCATCDGTPNQCTSCIGTNVIYGEVCYTSCPENTTKARGENKCVECYSGCKYCNWANNEENHPSVCVECVNDYKVLDVKCVAFCYDGYNLSSDGKVCIKNHDYTTYKNNDESSNSYLPFPHLIGAGLLCFIAAAGQARDGRALIISNLIVVINYVAVSSYVFQVIWGLLEEELFIALITGIVIIVQFLLDIIFCIPYNGSIATDVGFMQWKNRHYCIKNVLLVLSTIFSLQTMRLFYSRFLGFDSFFVKFTDFDNIFIPLNCFSLIQVILIHCVILVFSLYELTVLSWGNMLYIALIESLSLSTLLLILIAYEMKNTKQIKESLENDGKDYTEINDQSIKPFDEEKFRKELYDSLTELFRSTVKGRNSRYSFLNRRLKRRHSIDSINDNPKEKDPRKLRSFPSSPRTAKRKEVPLKQYGYSEGKVLPPDELPIKVDTNIAPSKDQSSIVPKEMKDFAVQTIPFKKIDIFRKYMNLYGYRREKLFEHTPNPLEMIPEKPEEEDQNAKKRDSHYFDMSPITIPLNSVSSSFFDDDNKHQFKENIKRPSSPPQVTEESLMSIVSKPLNPINIEKYKKKQDKSELEDLEKLKLQTMLIPHKTPEVFEENEYKYVEKDIKAEETKKSEPVYINEEEVMGIFDKDPNDGCILIKENKEGSLVDLRGRRVNKYGYLIDKDGNIVNQKNEFMMTKEDFDKELGEDSSYLRVMIPENSFFLESKKPPCELTKVEDIKQNVEGNGQKEDKNGNESVRDTTEISMKDKTATDLKVEKNMKIKTNVEITEDLSKEQKKENDIMEARKSISLDSLMDDTPSNYNIQNQRYEEPLKRLKYKTQEVITVKEETKSSISKPNDSATTKEKKTLYKRNFEKAFDEHNRKSSLELKNEPKVPKQQESKNEEFKGNQQKHSVHSKASEESKMKIILADLKDDEQDRVRDLEAMFLPSDPEDVVSVGSKGGLMASHGSNKSLKFKGLESIYLQKFDIGPKQHKKKKVNNKNKYRGSKTNLQCTSDEIGTHLKESYKAMQREYKHFSNTQIITGNENP